MSKKSKMVAHQRRSAATRVALASMSAATTMIVTTPVNAESAAPHYALRTAGWVAAPDSPHLPEPSYSYYTKPESHLGRTSPRPVEYSFLTPGDLGGHRKYQLTCKRSGLLPIRGGYGLLHCVDDGGVRITRLTTDVSYLRKLAKTPPWQLAGLEIPASKFPLKRFGWPDEWTLIAA